MRHKRYDITLFVNISTKHVETFVISLNELQKDPQKNIRALHAGEALNGHERKTIQQVGTQDIDAPLGRG